MLRKYIVLLLLTWKFICAFQIQPCTRRGLAVSVQQVLNRESRVWDMKSVLLSLLSYKRNILILLRLLLLNFLPVFYFVALFQLREIKLRNENLLSQLWLPNSSWFRRIAILSIQLFLFIEPWVHLVNSHCTCCSRMLFFFLLRLNVIEVVLHQRHMRHSCFLLAAALWIRTYPHVTINGSCG